MLEAWETTTLASGSVRAAMARPGKWAAADRPVGVAPGLAGAPLRIVDAIVGPLVCALCLGRDDEADDEPEDQPGLQAGPGQDHRGITAGDVAVILA
jgi:hypothetical protein